MNFEPHPYQQHAIDHVLENPSSGLFLSMGLGKTVSTLTAVNELMYERLEVSKVLVIAPKFVALNVWTAEVQKWDHLKHLKLSVITGNQTQRVAAIRAKADIYVINRENVTWLVGYHQSNFPYDMLVIDELSSFKSSKSHRFKSLRMILPKVSRVVGLTGTPAPNGLEDLWSQLYLLDQGKRLGRTVTGFRDAYLKPDKTNGHIVYKYKEQSGAREEVYKRIEDICISMKTEDYLTLPKRIDHTIRIQFDEEMQKKYNAFERDQVMALSGGEITALNAASLTNKLIQFSNGAVYDEDRAVHLIHDLKLDALEEIIESAGSVLLFYNFIHDKDRIMKRIKARELKTSKDIADWNAGTVPLMICHPASAGHGLNLQDGGDVIVWFGLPWSLELYLQANARLLRQGRKKPVMIYKLLCDNTMDAQIEASLEHKGTGQEELMKAVKAIVGKYL